MITINPKKILIPVDFSKTSNRAIKQGAFIARSCKGEIILLHVQKKNELLDIILPAIKIKNPSVITDYLEEKLEKLAAPIRKECGIPVTTLVSVGNITSEIVNIAEENKAGIIVMGTQGADSENGFFLGSNSYRVLTKSDIPVMTVRSESPKLGYKHILMPLDSSEHSRQKVKAALQLANNFSAQIHVLGILGKNEKNYEYKMEVIMEQVKKLAKEKKLVCTTEISFAENRAQKTLTYAKKIGADLIITMSDQTTGPSRLILGTYAHQLINDSKIPVLSIPPEINGDVEGGSIGGMW